MLFDNQACSLVVLMIMARSFFDVRSSRITGWSVFARLCLMIFDTLMARIGCARCALLTTSGSTHLAASKFHADAIKDLSQTDPMFLTKLSAQDRDKITRLLAQCRFHETELQSLLDMFDASEVKQHRRDSQVFMPNLLHYFTEEEWMKIANGCSLAEAMDMLICRLLALGGVNLSEKCKSWLVSLILHLGNLGGCTQEEKQDLFVWFKEELKRRRRRCEQVDPYILNLPLPNKLKADSPDLFQSVFGVQTPVPDKLCLESLQLPLVSCRPSGTPSGTPIWYPGLSKTASTEALQMLATRVQPHIDQNGHSPISPVASVIAAETQGSQSQSLDSEESLLHATDGFAGANDLSSTLFRVSAPPLPPDMKLMRECNSKVFTFGQTPKANLIGQPGSSSPDSPINVVGSDLPDSSEQRQCLNQQQPKQPLLDQAGNRIETDYPEQPSMKDAATCVAEEPIADLQQPRGQKRSLPDDGSAEEVKPNVTELPQKAVGLGRDKGKEKRSAECGTATPSPCKAAGRTAKAKTAPKKTRRTEMTAVKFREAKLSHEASRACFRVRFPNGSSQGFKYNKDDEEDQNAKQQDAIRLADEHNGVM